MVLAGGGTGGHIYPLLAFADCLRRHDPDLRITCIGTHRGMESEIIPQRGYDLRHVPAYQLPRSVNINLVRTPDRMWSSPRAARAILDEVEADAVVGFGGYVSVPAYIAAWRRKTPTIIHEVNVPPGVANRMGMRFTKHVALGFPHQAEQIPVAAATRRVVGVPLRPADRDARPGRPAAGGAGALRARPAPPDAVRVRRVAGARSINLAVSGAAKQITSAGVQVLHVIGARNERLRGPGRLAAPYMKSSSCRRWSSATPPATWRCAGAAR